jgi:uroporphyrinogen decarboxylase
MSTDKPTKKLLRALRGETLECPSFWLMRQAGRYLPEYRQAREKAGDFLTLCYTPDLAVEVTLQPLRRYGMDAAILFSDILVVADGLGQKVEFRAGEGPVLEPIRDAEGLNRLALGRPSRHLAPVYEAVSILNETMPETTALIGFAGAPWTVATYMVEGRGGTGFKHALRWARAEGNGFDDLIEILVEATSAHLLDQIRSGADVVQLFDTWAGLLHEDEFHRWVIEPTARIVERIKARHAQVPIIGFPRGCGDHYAAYVKQTGVDGIGLDSDVSLDWARDTLQPLAAVQGNLDNQTLVAGGEALDGAARRILAALAGGPFIFNLGHGVLPETPPENVARLAALIRQWPGS